ncbi:hypothetical protein JJE66_28005 [Bradyrhizobium diazoefficiens]|uniref:hypothetical protein n=1 Tax=Bradyrhizobium diazoefficiens TaxID=1355477 RepID=UPI00190B6589|nr:hypothetical protein [Bradyrhizobium diazoefficiens]MBK3665063.1 hypothetical protein [Bradyrhizobium diazoefficiens]
MPKFDKYTLFARLFPAIIAAAPALALTWVVMTSGTELKLVHGIAGTALAVLLWAFADAARRRGKAIEPRLIEGMGGLPSITMLRHRDATFDAATKARMHAFLGAKLSGAAPTSAQEAEHSEAADAFYKRAGDWLRENTRNQKKFDILFNENISYGYRRNLFALKRFALILNLLIVAGCVVQYVLHWPVTAGIGLLPVFVIAFLHACYLMAFSTRAAVTEAARIYARQLLLSVESPHLRKQEAAAGPRPKRKQASG